MPGIGYNPRFRALNAAGTAPLAGGKLYSYVTGTSTAKALYQDAACTTAHDNPIILNSAGETTFYLAPGGRYRLTLKDSSDNTQTGWPIDGVDSNGFYVDADAEPYLVKYLDGTDTITMGSISTVENTFSAPYAMAAGHIGYGMKISNGTDADHDINFTAGYRADSTYAYHILQGSALVKQLDASWTAGTNQGMLRSGLTIASSTWYYLFAIYNPTTGVADYFADTTATNPTLPTGYTIYRLIGAIRTDGSANIYAFTQVQHNKFIFKEPFTDYSTSALSTSWVTVGLTVPTIADIIAHITVKVVTPGVSDRILYIGNFDADPTAGLPVAYASLTSDDTGIAAVQVFPNSSGQIGVVASGASTTAVIYTIGFEMQLWR